MLRSPALSALIGLSLCIVPGVAMAQSVNVTRSILPNEPYTLIYPSAMVATGGAGEPLTINHPDAPLQCELTILPVEDTEWTAASALEALDDDEIGAAWSESLPGFVITGKGLVQYQADSALMYEGTSEDSSFGMPITLVHTETVAAGRGYALNCFYATDVAAQARPMVDFIIANFATRSDAECCIGAEVVDESQAQPAQ